MKSFLGNRAGHWVLPRVLDALLCAAVSAYVSCGNRGASSPDASSFGAAPAMRLEFVADLNVVTGTPFESVGAPGQSRPRTDAPPATGQASREEILRRKSSGDFGGISGIAYDADSGTLFALSDSSKPVVFTFAFSFEGSQPRLAPAGRIDLSGLDGTPLPDWTLDPEGIALTRRNTMLISSEGYASRKPPVDPAVFEFARNGEMLRRLPVPEKFLPRSGVGDTGIRHNAGFESLTLSPEGERLFVATEGALVQDGSACGQNASCLVRVIEYSFRDGGATPVQEYAYSIGPVVVPAGFEATTAVTGLVELLALGDGQLLALERDFAVGAGNREFHQQVRLYQVDLSEAAPVAGIASLSEQQGLRTARKTVLLNLDDIVGELSSGFQSLDNFEGMCLGPMLDGARTLILVSDNNYQERQRTAFLVFKLKK